MFKDTKAFSGFAVSDIPQAKAFYNDILGLDVTDAQGRSKMCPCARYSGGSSMPPGCHRDRSIRYRARHARTLLQQGISILDTVEQAGYADQPHLTRSLKRFMGQTPAQILRSIQR